MAVAPLQPKVFYGFGSYYFQTQGDPVDPIANKTGLETSGIVIFNNRAPLHITAITISNRVILDPSLSLEKRAGITCTQKLVLVDGSLFDYLRIYDPLETVDQIYPGQQIEQFKQYWSATQFQLGTHHFFFGEQGLKIASPCAFICTPLYVQKEVAFIPHAFELAHQHLSINGFEEPVGDAPPLKLR